MPGRPEPGPEPEIAARIEAGTTLSSVSTETDATRQRLERNLAAVRLRIAEACDRSGRDADEVSMVAVSKQQPDDLVRVAHRLGLRDFGENYAQSLRDRASALSDLEGVRWHLIGPLQTNKARFAARLASVFHALDRLELGEELSRRRDGAPLPCYLEVNVSGEPQKAGVAPDEVGALLEAVRPLSGIRAVGLMCMPPYSPDPEDSRPFYRRLRDLGERLGLPGLSMGMTGDYEVAVQEGATVVRIGTAIFGERDPT